MLQFMGVELQAEDGRIRMRGGQTLRSADIDVPGDLSSAAFVILGALLGADCELVIKGVGMNPTRTGVIEILRQMGAAIEIENCGSAGFEPVADIRVRSSVLSAIDVDPALVSLAIDEFPVLFIAAATARGRTRFSGIGELRVKESDRIRAMADGLRQLGIKVQEYPDGASVVGGGFTGGVVESHGDHRVAMSFAVAGTVADAPVTVRNTDAVDTSFPGFADLMRSVGADIRVSPGQPSA
jgi:3-phosphoshikimate 1-carboxyvinyltransferase